MNHRYICTAVIVAGTLIASFALAEDASQKTDPSMEEMMKKAEAAGTPGAAHKALEPLVGNWTAEVKSWMTPGAPPTVTQATAKSTWVMNGRFVQQEFTGDFMGKPFRGVSLTGYDNTKKKYSNVWIDDMHTSMFTSEGEGENNSHHARRQVRLPDHRSKGPAHETSPPDCQPGQACLRNA